jgi:hypothetical protein
MLESDVASIYKVEVKMFNRQVKRNIERFPSSLYMFQLTEEEKRQVIKNHPRLEGLKYSHSIPNVFTEYGVLMLCTVFTGELAVKVSLMLVETFVALKNSKDRNLYMEVDELIKRVSEHDKHIQLLLENMVKQEEKTNKIGF